MIPEFLSRAFPLLEVEGFEETSPETERYNCIAWASGAQDRWWWPSRMTPYFWPVASPNAINLDAFVEAFASLKFERCEGGECEVGFDRIAIYCRDGLPTHAARQLPDGRWTSKLGKFVDITHTLRGIEGPLYGHVAAFMRRPKSAG